MTLSRRRAPLTLLLIPWAVHAQSNSTAPTNLTAEVVDGGIALSWDAPTEDADSVTGYEVLRRRPRQGENSLLTYVADTGSAATTYTDTNATEPGERYVYRVKALRGGEKSGRSNYARVDLPESEPEPASTPEPTPAPTPEPTPEPTPVPAKATGLQSAEVYWDYVILGWDDPSDDSITHYKVLRREESSGSFTTIAENTGSADASYTDRTVSAETSYEYRVVAVNGGGSSPESDSLSVLTLTEATLTVVEPPEEPEENLIVARQMGSVDIPDANLRAVIEAALGKNPGDTITPAEMATLTTLNARGRKITDISGLEHATGLTSLNLSRNNISGTADLSAFTALTSLDLSWNGFNGYFSNKDLRSVTLPAAPALTSLDLSFNDMRSVSGLTAANLPQLRTLRLNQNHFTSITIPSLSLLTHLVLNSNDLTSFAIPSLPQLTNLVLRGNDLTSVSGLTAANLPRLTDLDLSQNELTSITIPSLSLLQTLDLSINPHTSFTIPSLPQLQTLRLIGHPGGSQGLTTLSGLTPTNLPIIRILNLSYNDLSTFTVPNFDSLYSLSLNYNDLTSITFPDVLNSLVGIFAKSCCLYEFNGQNRLTALTMLYVNPDTIVRNVPSGTKVWRAW